MSEHDINQIVCFELGGQLFGIDVQRVNDVHKFEALTPVPKATALVSGLLNLRGHIVLGLNLAHFLSRKEMEGHHAANLMINVRYLNESYGLLVDNVRDVVSVTPENIQPCPHNIDVRMAEFAQGTVRREGQLILILTIDRMLDAILSQDFMHCA